jgi:hypothetical protein
VREAVAFLLLACACGAATVEGRVDDARRTGSEPHPGAEGAGVWGGSDRTFAGLEARAAVLAPGLKQAAERESHGERIDLVRAADADTCVRVAFQAAAPITARLVDADGGVLAQLDAAVPEGALGDRGPVCVRRGDVVGAAADGAGGPVKWIAWASP